MGYKRKPNYHFATKNDTGIDKVPPGRLVIVEDYNGEVKSFIKKNNDNITETTTIENVVIDNQSITTIGGVGVGGAEKRAEIIATAGQTEFIVEYYPSSVDVYVNGIKLSSSEFTATSGTIIVLANGLNDGDVLFVNSREYTTIEGTLNTAFINTPTLTNITDGQTQWDLSAIYASDYATTDVYSGALDYVEWQLATDAGFTNIVESKTDSLLTYWKPTAWEGYTTYYIRVRYGSSIYMSDWSVRVEFTTGEMVASIDQPSITNIVDGATYVSLTPLIETSPFTVSNGTDTHASTQYQIATDINFTNVVYDVLSGTDLVSHLVENQLDIATVYYVRVRYNSSTKDSVWSDVVHFTTVLTVENFYIIENTLAGSFNEIVQDDLGNIYTAGYYQDDTTTSYGIWVAKFDIDGALLAEILLDGASWESVYDLIVDADGNLVVLAGGTYNPYLIKLSTSLSVISKYRFGDGVTSQVILQGLSQGTNGTYGVCGSSSSNGKTYVLNVSNDLATLNYVYDLQDTLSGDMGFNTPLQNASNDSVGNFIFTGYTQDVADGVPGYIYIAKFNETGASLASQYIYGDGTDIFNTASNSTVTIYNSEIIVPSKYIPGGASTPYGAIFKTLENFTTSSLVYYTQENIADLIVINHVIKTGTQTLVVGSVKVDGVFYGLVMELDSNDVVINNLIFGDGVDTSTFSKGIIDANGDLVVVGSTGNTNGATLTDAMLFKMKTDFSAITTLTSCADISVKVNEITITKTDYSGSATLQNGSNNLTSITPASYGVDSDLTVSTLTNTVNTYLY